MKKEEEAIGSLFKSVTKFSQIWTLSRSSRISLAMSRSSLAYILPRLYSLHQPQDPTTAQDVINSIVQCLLSRNTFFISQQAKKLRETQLIFVYLSQQQRWAQRRYWRRYFFGSGNAAAFLRHQRKAAAPLFFHSKKRQRFSTVF